MRILVLGSTGYLGTHVVEGLRALPGVLVLGGGRAPTAEYAIDLATVRREELAKTLASAAPDTVINCAGATGGDPVTLAEVNARGPAVLCAALREAAPGARLVHLGSAAEYGPGVPDVRVTESAATRPLAPYGATKLAGTVAVTTSGLDAVVLRVGNPVGPGAPPTGLPGRISRPAPHGRPRRRAPPRRPLRPPRLRRRTRRRPRRPRRIALRGPGRDQHRLGPRRAPPRRRGRPRPRRFYYGGALHELDAPPGPIRPTIGHPRPEPDHAAPVSYPYPDGCGSWQQADVRTARDRLGWRPRINLEESLADIWMEAACRI